MSHWCKDIERDIAVRASEDNRPGPLPTLEECIERVTNRRPVDAGGGGNVTGLRVAYGQAVVDRLTAERDAAIREREELRSQVQILDEGQPTAPSDLGVWCTAKDLSARCKELAARLVTTAVRASSAETALREIFAQDYTRSAVNGASWKMHDIAEKALQSAPAASGAAGAGVVLPECPFTPESTHTMGWWEAIGKVKKALAAAGVTAKEVGRE